MADEWDNVASEYRDQFYKILWEETGLDPARKASSSGQEHQPFTILDFGCGTGLLVEKLIEEYPNAHIICVDAAEKMMMKVHQKILERGWTNIQTFCIILSHYETIDVATKEKLNDLNGKVDLIIASSVLSFIPKADINKTIEVLSSFLKPGGLFIHSDWPYTVDQSPNGFTEERATNLYQTGKLKLQSTSLRSIQMEGEDAKIFVGVAQAPLNEM